MALEAALRRGRNCSLVQFTRCKLLCNKGWVLLRFCLFFFEEPGNIHCYFSRTKIFFWLFSLIRNSCWESQDPPALKPNHSCGSAAKNKMFSNPPHRQEPSQTSQPPVLRVSAADTILLVLLVWKMSHAIIEGKQKAVGELKLLQSCCCMKQRWATVTTETVGVTKHFSKTSCHSSFTSPARLHLLVLVMLGNLNIMLTKQFAVLLIRKGFSIKSKFWSFIRYFQFTNGNKSTLKHFSKCSSKYFSFKTVFHYLEFKYVSWFSLGYRTCITSRTGLPATPDTVHCKYSVFSV